MRIAPAVRFTQSVAAPPTVSDNKAIIDLSTFKPVEAGGVIGGNPPVYVDGKLANGQVWTITTLGDELMISAPNKMPRDLVESEARQVNDALKAYLAGGEQMENMDQMRELQKDLQWALDH